MRHKYAIGIEYSGYRYSGWQQQKHSASIQQHLQTAIGFVANHPVHLVCAGRTDAGVHAIEQVAHFESDADRDNRAWVLGSNCRLPKDIRVKWIVPVDETFHARFSATARSYRYVILNREVASAVFHDRCYRQFRALNHYRMHKCAQVLCGEHDFSSFRAAGCQAKSASRYVYSVMVSRQGELIYLDIKANAFVYHMVRNIVGSLLEVGRGERSSAWFEQLLAVKDRKQAGMTAPAAGLYLLCAFYPGRFRLPRTMQKPILF